MQDKYARILQPKLDPRSLAKLSALDNDKLHAFVADAVELCRPESVFVADDSEADVAYVRARSIELGEEKPLAIEGHTIHYDGMSDLARDPKATKYLLPKGMSLGQKLAAIDRDEGLGEIRGYLAGSMTGRRMLVRFFSLGPANSPFSISCIQITDSCYVAHSEDLLYRGGYEQFKRLGGAGAIFRFLHSAGRMVNNISADTDKRRIYIDVAEEMVYSCNTQYGGNTIGLKKLALRLAIRRADREGWLAEHMFLMGVHGPEQRVTYFAGAFPSACGKTSTAMLPGETILGDDIAYFRANDGEFRGVNVEGGIFGIIEDVNSKDDPVIYKVLTTPGEVIFSNVLVKDGRPYWIGMGSEIPAEGVNHSGQWFAGKTNEEGKAIPCSDKNARYTIALRALANLDGRAGDPMGVPVQAVVYGGRDSDTCVPVQQSFDWEHGIVAMAASQESESTAATIGAQGVRTFDMMSILQFLAIPLGKYVQNNLEIGRKVAKAPLIFGSNYFLKDKAGKYLNGKGDKAVWIKWMELRVHGEAHAITTPTGLIPKYEDLRRLFVQVLDKQYSRQEYIQQFTLRIPENLAKVDRIEKIYREIPDTPKAVMEVLGAQRKRLLDLQARKGDYVSPMDM